MKRDHSICPNCGSGDIEFLLQSTASDDPFSDVPTANRHCFVCGVRWETDEINLETHSA